VRTHHLGVRLGRDSANHAKVAELIRYHNASMAQERKAMAFAPGGVVFASGAYLDELRGKVDELSNGVTRNFDENESWTRSFALETHGER
jgi:hypothetical protein